MNELKTIYFLFLRFNKKRRLISSSIITMLSAILELFALYLIIPIISVFYEQSKYNDFATNFSKYLHIEITPIRLKISLGFFLIGIFAFKCFLSIYASANQLKIVFKTAESISKKMFFNYLSQPFNFYIKKDNSFFVRNLNTEVNQVIENGLLPASVIITETTVLIILVLGLFYFQPVPSLIFCMVMLIYWKINSSLTGSYLRKWGALRHATEQDKLKTIQSAFEAIKEVYLYKIQNLLEIDFTQCTGQIFTLLRKHVLLLAVPRHILELLAVVTLLMLILSMLFFNTTSFEASFTFIIFFAGVLFKIIPSSYRIANALNSVKYCSESLRTIDDALSLRPLEEMQFVKISKDVSFFSIIIKDLCFSYGSTQILKNLNYNFSSGDFVLVKGKSGAGKSTLADLLLKLKNPTSGEIIYKANNLISEKKLVISYLPQSSYIFNNTLLYNIILSNKLSCSKRLETAICCAGLRSVIESSPQKLLQNVGPKGNFLSGGQKQRIAIARALYRRPNLLVLDEPTSALDTDSEINIMTKIRECFSRSCILVISHSEKLDLIATKILLLN